MFYNASHFCFSRVDLAVGFAIGLDSHEPAHLQRPGHDHSLYRLPVDQFKLFSYPTKKMQNALGGCKHNFTFLIYKWINVISHEVS